MTSTALSFDRAAGPSGAPRAGRVRGAAADVAAQAVRVLLNYRHSPGLIVASLAAPLAMLVVFGYVFGSAITAPGSGNYREYLMPGLFVLIAFNSVVPAMVGAARDAGRGMTDRLLSMPISRGGALLGQALADLAVSAVVLACMVAMGLAVGWRAHDGLGRAGVALALLLLFRFAMFWVGLFLGLLCAREEIASPLSVLVFPVSMITNVFVPTGGMTPWLRDVADWNPISTVTAACRDLFGSAPAAAAGSPWPLTHPVAATLGWSLVLLAICGLMAVQRFAAHGR